MGKNITFTEDYTVKDEEGKKYKEGKTYPVSDDTALHFIRRAVAFDQDKADKAEAEAKAAAKEADYKAKADKKAADDKAKADKKAADDKVNADKKAADDKVKADKKAAKK